MAEAAGVEPARALRDGLANRCHTVRRRLLTISDYGLRIADSQDRTISPIRILHSAISSRLAEGYGVEPYTVISRRSFQDCLTHSTVGPSLNFWQGRSDLNRESRFWRPMVLPVSLHPYGNLVHVVGLAPTKSLGGRPIYSRVPLLLSHTCARKICYAKNR